MLPCVKTRRNDDIFFFFLKFDSGEYGGEQRGWTSKGGGGGGGVLETPQTPQGRNINGCPWYFPQRKGAFPFCLNPISMVRGCSKWRCWKNIYSVFSQLGSQKKNNIKKILGGFFPPIFLCQETWGRLVGLGGGWVGIRKTYIIKRFFCNPFLFV